MNSKNNLNGTVTISVEDFERLREIESKTPCVKMIYGNGDFKGFVYLTNSEFIKEADEKYKERIENLESTINSKNKEISEHKETIKKLNDLMNDILTREADRNKKSWWKKILNIN